MTKRELRYCALSVIANNNHEHAHFLLRLFHDKLLFLVLGCSSLAPDFDISDFIRAENIGDAAI